jgi:preprotein translocase subunit SecG
MDLLKIIAIAFLVIFEIFLIAVVLLQSGRSAGLSGAIGGASETFFGKNKAKSMEGKLELWTKISAGAFIVLAIVLSMFLK